MKRIVINGRFLGQPTTGVQRYATQIVLGFDRLLEQGEIDRARYDIVIATPTGTKPAITLRHIPIHAVGRLRGHAWEQLEFSRFAPESLLLNLCNVAPLFRPRQVVTIHDASVFATPEAYALGFRLWYRLVLLRLSHHATRLLTVSQFSRSELSRYCGIDPGRIEVIYHGADHLASVVPEGSILVRHALEGKPYVLAVSSKAAHKNLPALVHASRRIHQTMPDVRMVVAGGSFPHVFGTGATETDGFIHTGYISDGELKALYQQASCLAYPSRYEGFGLPPLEAMANGCPVVAARAGSLPEVCGDAAVYCDPADPQSLADAVLRVLQDRSFGLELRSRGFARAGQFSWLACARHTFAAVEEALAA